MHVNEIPRRTQETNESIRIYLAVIEGYLKRLTCPISKVAILKIWLGNIVSFD